MRGCDLNLLKTVWTAVEIAKLEMNRSEVFAKFIRETVADTPKSHLLKPVTSTFGGGCFFFWCWISQ